MLSNADQISKELEQYSAEIKRKLTSMVAGFAGDVAFQAAINTPRATEDYVASHQSLYEQRERFYQIPIAPGYHQGAWQYSEDEPELLKEINTPAQVEYSARETAKAKYRVGENFYIAAKTPNMEYLNQRDNIAGKVTEAGVLAAYTSNLQLHFDRG